MEKCKCSSMFREKTEISYLIIVYYGRTLQPKLEFAKFIIMSRIIEVPYSLELPTK